MKEFLNENKIYIEIIALATGLSALFAAFLKPESEDIIRSLAAVQFALLFFVAVVFFIIFSKLCFFISRKIDQHSILEALFIMIFATVLLWAFYNFVKYILLTYVDQLLEIIFLPGGIAVILSVILAIKVSSKNLKATFFKIVLISLFFGFWLALDVSIFEGQFLIINSDFLKVLFQASFLIFLLNFFVVFIGRNSKKNQESISPTKTY